MVTEDYGEGITRDVSDEEMYRNASVLVARVEEKLGGLAKYLKDMSVLYPTDISNALRGIAGNITKDAERARKLKEKYRMKSGKFEEVPDGRNRRK